MANYLPEILEPDELENIYRLWAIEKVWWGRWRKLLRDGKTNEHWSIRGEDAWYTEEQEVFGRTIYKNVPLIDMREESYLSPITGESMGLGYVRAERVVPWRRGIAPLAINWFTKRFFDRELFGYQLYFYYVCQSAMMIVGGRGSAKTSGLALVHGAWASLHPGQSWAHFALLGDQAMFAYKILIELGSQKFEDGRKSWYDTFVEDNKMSPHGMIKIKPWAEGDTGTEILYRPLGQSRDASSTRSIDVRRTSIDECTYDVADPNILSIAEASARGTNSVVQSWLPDDQKENVRQAKVYLGYLDSKKRTVGLTEQEQKDYTEIEDLFWDLGVSCNLTSIRTGNRGPYYWIDELLEQGTQRPESLYAETVSFLINPHLDTIARQKLVDTYPDELQARTELYAERPMGAGLFFTPGSIAKCESKALSTVMQNALSIGAPGYEMQKYGAYMVHWQLPPRPGKIYVLGGDPGTGLVPKRDSFSVMVWELDLSTYKAQLVFWKWGNVEPLQRGSFTPFVETIKEAKKLYHITTANSFVQVGGQERGIIEIAFAENQLVTPLQMNENNKGLMANYTRELISKGIYQWPMEAGDLSIQLSRWIMLDKELAQDLVMALFSSSWVIFSYVADFLQFQPEATPKSGNKSAKTRGNTHGRRRHKGWN